MLLLPICRNVPDNPVLHATAQQWPYIADPRNLDEMCPESGGHELFVVNSLAASATNVFTVLDPEKLNNVRTKSRLRAISDIYLANPTALLTAKETVATG